MKKLLPGVGLFFVALYLLFVITGGEVQQGGRGNSFNKSDSGYFLFYKLFKQLGYKVSHWYKQEPPLKNGCMIYLDYFPKDKERMDAIKQWVKQGNILFLAGIHGNEDPLFSHQIKHGRAYEVNVNKKSDFFNHRGRKENFSFSFTTSRYLVPTSKDKILLSSESGALLIERKLGYGMVYLFPDNNLFTNRNFSNEDHALLLNRVMGTFYTLDTFFYEYGTGVYRVKNPVLILFKGNLLYVTLHLFLLGIIFLLWRSKRFGKPVQAGLYKQRSLGLHLRAMGNFYRKTGALKLVSTLSSKYLLYRLKKRLNIKKNIPRDQWVEVLARESGIAEEKLTQLLQEPYELTEAVVLKKRKEIYDLIEKIKGSR